MPAAPTRLSQLLTISLLIAIVVVLAAVSYLASTSRPREAFTEFYLLGPSGKADNYPRVLTLGEQASVVVGVVNREHIPATYSLEVATGGEVLQRTGPITLADDGKWESALSFSPTRRGSGQTVEFLLYRDDAPSAYRRLTLVVDVR